MTIQDLALTLSDASLAFIGKYDPQEFISREEKDKAVTTFFADFEKPYGVYSNILGYLTNYDGERIAYVEEHFADAGSDDYMYTAVYTTA